MKIHTIIPARGGSKGIPRKNVISVAGKPLIAWTIEQSLRSKRVEKTYVSTDDSQIADISVKYGAEIIWRPEDLCSDVASTESAVLHTLSYIQQEKEEQADAVVLLQATSPLRKADDIDKAIEKFIDEKADSLFSGARLEDFLLWEQREGKWFSINYDYRNRGRRQDRSPQFVENGSIYIFKPEIIIRDENRIGGKLVLYELEFWQTWEIDTIEDVDLVEYYLNRKIKPLEVEYLRNSKIQLVAFDFDGVLTDNKVLTLQDGSEGIIANRSDGLAVRELKKMNLPMLIISTEENEVVKARAKKLQLPILNGIHDKKSALEKYCDEHHVAMKNTIFIGNDINDLKVMQSVGWPLCPHDANEEVINISKIVLSCNGGNGVIRELWNILKSEGKY